MICFGYDKYVIGSSNWLKTRAQDLRKKCTYVQLECDDKFFCGFKFSSAYY